MTINSSNVGRSWGPITAEADARWTMAYAAGIGDETATYYDTTATAAVPVHPMFPVSAEWALLRERIAEAELWSRKDALRGVHATHDLILHQPLTVGAKFSLTAVIDGLEQRRPGAYQVTRHDAIDHEGRPLWTSWAGSLFRAVDIDGPTRTSSTPVPISAAQTTVPVPIADISIRLTDAHVYTECAKIWNPIHTDIAVARLAGLDGPILHGTATLAKAVTALLAHFGVDGAAVRRITARFSAPAITGDVLTVRAFPQQRTDASIVQPFDIVSSGRTVLRDGTVVVGTVR